MKLINQKALGVTTKPYRIYLYLPKKFDYSDIMKLAGQHRIAPSHRWKYNAMCSASILQTHGLAKEIYRHQVVNKSGRHRRVFSKTPRTKLTALQQTVLKQIEQGNI